MMKSIWKICWTTTSIAITAAISPVLFTATVTAQNITAAPDGTGTMILPNGQRFDITGGTQAGANLFHSFQQFGLNQGQIANFLSQPNIQNILGRVVGGDPSVINGLIQLTGGNSNLYIMNPAGIIFGSNASLNVPSAFTATTANGIQVGNAWFGMNTNVSDLKNLTGSPNAFAFTTPTNATQASGVILNQGNLSVSSGKSITLVGGIVINTGEISSPNGKINIVATPDGKYVKITPEGSVLSFDLPVATQQELGNLKPMTVVNLPKLLAGTGVTAPTKAGTAVVTGNLSAAGIDVLAHRYDTSQASLNAANIQQGWNFVFIDSTIKNYQTLLDGTKGGSAVTVINPDQYGIRQVTETLASVTGANSLHIVSEGDAGNFWLGKDFVSTGNIAKYSNDLQAWKTALSPAANILLYACNLASGENGVALVQAVKNLTGRDVAASTNRTGAVALGGDWNLEYRTGGNPVTTIFSNTATQSYKGVLALFTVLNTADAGMDSLRGRIAAANVAAGADEIRFDPTVFNGSQGAILLASTLVINDPSAGGDLTISGIGATNVTISGQNAVQVFSIESDTNTTFDRLNIINGNAGAGSGGGIGSLNAPTTIGTITVNNSTITGGQAVTFGAGIFNRKDIVINNSTISGNTGSFAGAGIFSLDGNVTVSNSTIANNLANNLGGGSGGGIAAVNVTVSNSTISDNVAGNGIGGGIVSDNAVTIADSRILRNTASSDGGGINSGGALTITNSTVSGNTTTSDDGGGIFSNNGDVTITNSIVSGNTAGDDGGGIYKPNTTGTFNINNSTISNNTANGLGGGIYFIGVVLNITNSTISNNRSITFNGGGIQINNGSSTVNIVNSTISNNTAVVDSGGGIRNFGTLNLTNVTIANNTAAGNGGGISNPGGTVNVRNTIIAQNTNATSPDIFGAFVNQGNNLIGKNNGSTGFVNGVNGSIVGTSANPIDPKLAPLGNYGGTTQTHALLPNSAALDAGNNANAPVGNDQRGATRIVGGAVDIGAFESQGFSLTPLANTTPQNTNVNTNFANLLGVQVTENFVNAAIPASAILVTFTPSASGASGSFAGNANVFTNSLGIAVAPTFTANEISGSYAVSATATGFTSANFVLTNKVTGGFGGVFPSREERERSTQKLEEQKSDLSFTQVLCLDDSLVSDRTSSIPACKKTN